MKNLFVILVALTLLFSYACQEGNITDPVQESAVTNQSQKDQTSSYNQGEFKLNGFMYDPIHESDLSKSAEITGKISFEHNLFILDPIPPAPQSYVLLKLRVNSGIDVQCPNGDKRWKVNQYVEEKVYVPVYTAGYVILEKTFPIENPCCHPVDLVVRFRVDNKTLKLESTQLRESPADFIIDVF